MASKSASFLLLAANNDNDITSGSLVVEQLFPCGLFQLCMLLDTSYMSYW